MKIIEITGDTKSGKTFMALSIMTAYARNKQRVYFINTSLRQGDLMTRIKLIAPDLPEWYDYIYQNPPESIQDSVDMLYDAVKLDGTELVVVDVAPNHQIARIKKIMKQINKQIRNCDLVLVHQGAKQSLHETANI